MILVEYKYTTSGDAVKWCQKTFGNTVHWRCVPFSRQYVDSKDGQIIVEFKELIEFSDDDAATLFALKWGI